MLISLSTGLMRNDISAELGGSYRQVSGEINRTYEAVGRLSTASFILDHSWLFTAKRAD